LLALAPLTGLTVVVGHPHQRGDLGDMRSRSHAVQLRFNAAYCPQLPEAARARLLKMAGSKLSKDGAITISAQRFRTQDRNRSDARERLKELILKALVPPPPPRKITKPTYGSQLRRLEGKKVRGNVKAMRNTRPDED